MAGVFGQIVDGGAGRLYIATEGSGLLEYDGETGKSVWHLYDASDGHNIVKSLLKEGDRIWCGTNSGTVYSYDIRSGRFHHAYTLPVPGSI